MGTVFAPFAQCITWAILLASVRPGDTEGIGKGAGVNWEGLDQTLPPTWIPLRGGGGIFVNLDNVLVVSHGTEPWTAATGLRDPSTETP